MTNSLRSGASLDLLCLLLLGIVRLCTLCLKPSGSAITRLVFPPFVCQVSSQACGLCRSLSPHFPGFVGLPNPATAPWGGGVTRLGQGNPHPLGMEAGHIRTRIRASAAPGGRGWWKQGSYYRTPQASDGRSMRPLRSQMAAAPHLAKQRLKSSQPPAHTDWVPQPVADSGVPPRPTASRDRRMEALPGPPGGGPR